MKRWAIGILHPSAVLRGSWPLGPAQAATLGRVLRNEPMPTLADVERAPPGSVLYPTLPQVERCLEEARTLGAVALDIENAGRYLICVGLVPFSREPQGQLGTPLCLRFRTQGGARYWSNFKDHLAAVELLGRLLADPTVTKVFHNGVTYDVPVLEEHGFEVVPPIIDTMLMQNLAYSEQPKGLQFCANQYLGAPHWKWLVDADVEEEGKA